MDTIEERQGQYLFKVSFRGLVNLLMDQSWRPLRRRPGWEGCEFEYRCQDWNRTRRFVAVRRLVQENTEGLLFPQLQYEFFCSVTNLDLTPWKTHKFYGKRATSENWIEWCKNQIASGSILTQDFWANSALFQTYILAYNLLVRMMWLTTKKVFREEPNTISAWLIKTPARLITSGRRWIFKLPQAYFFKEQWKNWKALWRSSAGPKQENQAEKAAHTNVQSNGGIGFPACAIPEVIPLKLNVYFDCDLVSESELITRGLPKCVKFGLDFINTPGNISLLTKNGKYVPLTRAQSSMIIPGSSHICLISSHPETL